jgi:hypothetical protein
MAAQKPYGELPPHWAATAIESVIATHDPKKIARAFGDAIANSQHVEEAIENALIEPQPEGIKGPGLAHRVRRAVASAIGD